MKAPFQILSLIILLFSCKKAEDAATSFPSLTFDGPFPKRNYDLTKILGDHLMLKSGSDTTSLKISGFKNYNLITDANTGDTLFKGSVCKFRGLYYLNEQLTDTSYLIYAIMLKGNLLYGLNSVCNQTIKAEEAIKIGKYQKMLVSRVPEMIRLHPDKREMRLLFSEILKDITPDTILNIQNHVLPLTGTTNEAEAIESEELEIFSNVYPNPTKDYVYIELQKKTDFSYQLTDLNGKMVFQGQIKELKSKIDLSGQPSGVFYLTITDLKNNPIETLKIIKQ